MKPNNHYISHVNFFSQNQVFSQLIFSEFDRDAERPDLSVIRSLSRHLVASLIIANEDEYLTDSEDESTPETESAEYWSELEARTVQRHLQQVPLHLHGAQDIVRTAKQIQLNPQVCCKVSIESQYEHFLFPGPKTRHVKPGY